MESKARADVDVVSWCARGLRRSNIGEGPLRKWSIRCVKGVCIGLVDWYVVFDSAIEVWFQSARYVSRER